MLSVRGKISDNMALLATHFTHQFKNTVLNKLKFRKNCKFKALTLCTLYKSTLLNT